MVAKTCRPMTVNWVLEYLPATSDELLDSGTEHVNYNPCNLDTLLRGMRDAGLIACVDGVWYTRTKPA